jgi:hypothetical protein
MNWLRERVEISRFQQIVGVLAVMILDLQFLSGIVEFLLK